MPEEIKKPDVDSKVFHWENTIKGLFTTVIGMVLMVLAVYGWWEDHVSDTQAIVIGVAGFALMFLRVKLEDTILDAIKNKLNPKKE